MPSCAFIDHIKVSSLPLLNYLDVFCRIDERRRAVKDRRDKVRAKCQERRAQLGASQAFQEFKRDAEEVHLCCLSHFIFHKLLCASSLLALRLDQREGCHCY